MNCRHCTEPLGETNSYAMAMVLGVGGDIMKEVQSMEKQSIPCFSSCCHKCHNVSILNNWRGHFPSQAAYLAHSIAAVHKLRKYDEGAFFKVTGGK